MDLTLDQIDEIFKIQNDDKMCHFRKRFEINKIIGFINSEKEYSDSMTLVEYQKLINKK